MAQHVKKYHKTLAVLDPPERQRVLLHFAIIFYLWATNRVFY